MKKLPKSKTYEEFVEKFKPKKTTDDCCTPPTIYDIVKQCLQRIRDCPRQSCAAMMKRYARYGVDLKIRADDCIQVGSLDAQKQAGKGIFGSGLLLCERAAAVRWELSDREKAIIQQLG